MHYKFYIFFYPFIKILINFKKDSDRSIFIFWFSKSNFQRYATLLNQSIFSLALRSWCHNTVLYLPCIKRRGYCDRSSGKMEHPRVSFPLALAKVAPTRGSKFRRAWETRQKRARSRNEHRISRQQLLPRYWNRRNTVANSRAKLPISWRETRKRRGLRTYECMDASEASYLVTSYLRRSESHNLRPWSSTERKARLFAESKKQTFPNPFYSGRFFHFVFSGRDSRGGPVKQL